MSGDPLHACTILMVDDEEANLDLLEAFLSGEGYGSLVRTTDARQAVPLFLEHEPDLVLLDLHMPYRTGFEVLRDLGVWTPAGDYLPVLVLTADVTPEAKERALSEGARDFLTKPLDAVEVLLRVRNLLETRVLYREQQRARRAAEAGERRAALLADASRILGASLDHTTALPKLARRVVPELADLSLVALERDGGLACAGVAHAQARAADGAMLADVVERRAGGERLLALAAGGEPLLWEAGTADGEPLGALLAPLGARSAVLAPLRSAGETLGALLLVRMGSSAAYGEDDRRLAGEIASRVALAVENARLFAGAQWATRARDRMLSVVAHDLRNPLASVTMGSEMLLQLAGAEDGYERRTLSHIFQATQRMQRLIEDLLDVAGFEQGVFSLLPGPITVDSLIAEVEGTFRPVAEARSIGLELAGASDLAALRADGGRLVQVLSNLVGNAVKFTPDGGRVTVSWEPTEAEVRFSVADTGPGISAEDLPHVFGAFWQAPNAERRGVGLGLWIAHSIVAAHGGRIWVDSRPGEGTVFHFTVPWATERPAPGPGLIPDPLPG